MWIGTLAVGVYKYDGKQFIHFNADNGFCPSAANCLMATTDGAMFVGTQGNGLCKINDKSFKHYNQLRGGNNGIANSILAIKRVICIFAG
ncbi:MAG: hypothetical protein IPG89_10120 [Bacteroidetes bacterium]|nr:hypothetical protein [Bacteroidota bacterium]